VGWIEDWGFRNDAFDVMRWEREREREEEGMGIGKAHFYKLGVWGAIFLCFSFIPVVAEGGRSDLVFPDAFPCLASAASSLASLELVISALDFLKCL